jgi:hypothetical protein
MIYVEIIKLPENLPIKSGKWQSIEAWQAIGCDSWNCVRFDDVARGRFCCLSLSSLLPPPDGRFGCAGLDLRRYSHSGAH